MNIIQWDDVPICWQEMACVTRGEAILSLSESVWARIEQGRVIVQHIVSADQVACGINTGLGALYNITLSEAQLRRLPRNTLLSHACGVEPLLKVAPTRAIMCVAVANFSHGRSGVSARIMQQLLMFLQHGVTPQVSFQGSVSYLTHMTHIGPTLMGVGDVLWQGQAWSAAEVLSQLSLQSVAPGAKEGLSPVNGTPCMTGLACLALDDAERLMNWADVTGAMSFEAPHGQLMAFDAKILALEADPGIQTSDQRLCELLTGNRLLAGSEGLRTQGVLSLRSMPQVYSACRDQFSHAQTQTNAELNVCTDNPLILNTLEQWRVVSQAHPHGESVAIACDLLAIAMAELGTIIERRLDRLVNPLVSGLLTFLVIRFGVNSGMMTVQYVAAPLYAENRQLAQPAVLDNFVTSALQEDHLGLGTSAALKLQHLLGSPYQILGVEYLLAAQGLGPHEPQTLAAGTRQARDLLHQSMPGWEGDH